jgi:hypothetical protein
MQLSPPQSASAGMGNQQAPQLPKGVAGPCSWGCNAFHHRKPPTSHRGPGWVAGRCTHHPYHPTCPPPSAVCTCEDSTLQARRPPWPTMLVMPAQHTHHVYTRGNCTHIHHGQPGTPPGHQHHQQLPGAALPSTAAAAAAAAAAASARAAPLLSVPSLNHAHITGLTWPDPAVVSLSLSVRPSQAAMQSGMCTSRRAVPPAG